MIYRLPTIDDYDILKNYVCEHYSNHEKSISASLNLTNMKYEDWVSKINKNSNEASDEWGKYYLYLVFDNDKLIGLLNIRFDLSSELRDLYGHIGYGVRPSERGKGYATRMLKYALDICKKKQLKEVIVGCYEDNYGSNRVIQKNGGVLMYENTKDVNLSDFWTINLTNKYYKISL